MTEKHAQPNRVEDLISQDRAVASFEFGEFRMNLEASIQHLEQRARNLRRATLWALAIFITCVLSTLPLEMLGLLGQAQWVRIVWGGCGGLAMFATGILAAIYQYRYQPALERMKNDLQTMTNAELQHQVAELQQQFVELRRKLDRHSE